MPPFADYPSIVRCVVHLYAVLPVNVELARFISNIYTCFYPARLVGINRIGVQGEGSLLEVELNVCSIEIRPRATRSVP